MEQRTKRETFVICNGAKGTVWPIKYFITVLQEAFQIHGLLWNQDQSIRYMCSE